MSSTQFRMRANRVEIIEDPMYDHLITLRFLSGHGVEARIQITRTDLKGIAESSKIILKEPG